MRHGTVAFPAIAGRVVDPRHEFLVASYAVFLRHGFRVRREFRVIRKRSAEKKRNVFHSVDTLPQKMIGDIIVRQMAVDALFASVRPVMGPCFIVVFVQMALRAEFGRFREKYHVRRPEKSVNGGRRENGADDPEQYDMPAV